MSSADDTHGPATTLRDARCQRARRPSRLPLTVRLPLRHQEEVLAVRQGKAPSSVLEEQQSASVVDLLPKTALVQAARRLADVPSHAMLIFKQQPCSRREAKKDKSSQATQGLARVGLAPSFARACLLRSKHRVRKVDFGLSPRAPWRAESTTFDLEKKTVENTCFSPRAFSKTRR